MLEIIKSEQKIKEKKKGICYKLLVTRTALFEKIRWEKHKTRTSKWKRVLEAISRAIFFFVEKKGKSNKSCLSPKAVDTQFICLLGPSAKQVK